MKSLNKRHIAIKKQPETKQKMKGKSKNKESDLLENSVIENGCKNDMYSHLESDFSQVKKDKKRKRNLSFNNDVEFISPKKKKNETFVLNGKDKDTFEKQLESHIDITHSTNEIICSKLKKKIHRNHNLNEKENNVSETQVSSCDHNLSGENDYCKVKKKKRKMYEKDNISDTEFHHIKTDISNKLDLNSSSVQDTEGDSFRKNKKKKELAADIKKGNNQSELEGQLQVPTQTDDNLCNELYLKSYEGDSSKVKKKKRNKQNLIERNVSDTEFHHIKTGVSVQSDLNSSFVQENEGDIKKKRKKKKLAVSITKENNQSGLEGQLQVPAHADDNLSDELCLINYESNSHKMKKKKHNKHNEKDNLSDTEFHHNPDMSVQSDLNSSFVQENEGDTKKKRKKKKLVVCIKKENNQSGLEGQAQIPAHADDNLSNEVCLINYESNSHKMKKKKHNKHNHNEKDNLSDTEFHHKTDMSIKSDINSSSVQDTEGESFRKKKKKKEVQLQVPAQTDDNLCNELCLKSYEGDSSKAKKKKRNKQNLNERNNVSDTEFHHIKTDVSVQSDLNSSFVQENEGDFKKKRKKKKLAAKSENNQSELGGQLQVPVHIDDSLSDELCLKKCEASCKQTKNEQRKSNDLNSFQPSPENELELQSKKVPVDMDMCKISNCNEILDISNNHNPVLNTNQKASPNSENALNNAIKDENESDDSCSLDIEYHDLDIDSDMDYIKFDLSDVDSDSDDDSNHDIADENLVKRNEMTGSGCTSSNKNSEHDLADENAELNKHNEDLDVLKTLQVQIDFRIPPLHEVVVRSTGLTKEQKEMISNLGLHFKTGRFTKKEDEQIKKNWQEFIKRHNLEDNPELFYNLNSGVINRYQKQNFLQFMSQNLPDRPPCNVFARFRRLLALAKTQKGRYSKEEDEYILKMMEKTQCKFGYITKIAKHLGRPMDSVENRISILNNKHNRKIRWKRNNMAAFLKYLIKITKVNDVYKLKNRHITNKEFAKLSKELDNVPVRILKCAWFGYIHHRLFIPENSCDLRKVKYDLIQLLVKNGEKEWKSVKWNKYVKHFDGFLNIKLYQLLKMFVINNVSPNKRKDLGAALEIISKIPITKMRKHIIYKIKYQNDTVLQIIPKHKEKTK